MADNRDQKNDRKSTLKKALGYASTAVIAIALIAVVSVLISVFVAIGKGQTPTVFGYRFYNVLTDSMTPNLVPGDVIIAKKVTEKSVKELQTGDVVTYIAESGVMEGQLVTHRIVEGIHYDETLQAEVVTTKGDKAGAQVDYPVRLERIQSVMVRKSKALPWLYKAFRSGAGFALIVIVPLGVMLISLVVRLVQTMRHPDEEEAKEAQVADSAVDKEARIAEIKARAIAEYIANAEEGQDRTEEEASCED